MDRLGAIVEGLGNAAGRCIAVVEFDDRFGPAWDVA